MEIEMLDEIVMPEGTNRTKYSEPLLAFVKSDKKSLVVRCKNMSETQSCVMSFKRLNAKHNLNLCICQRSTTVYAIKG